MPSDAASWIDWLEHPAFAGRIGMTRCPGTWTEPGELAADLEAIREAGASALVTLNEAGELHRAGLGDFGAAVGRAQLAWFHLPIPDFEIPDEIFETRWREVGPELAGRLREGETIVVHCYGGLGRTGIVVARLLVESGEPPARAIRLVRAARPGTVQNAEQEAYVLNLGPGDG